MKMISTTHRVDQNEAMDDFSLQGVQLKDALDKIAKINRFLGGNRVTLQGIADLLKNIPKERVIHIADIGCGNGDMLRVLADYGKNHGWKFHLTGIDANQYTLDYAKIQSKGYENIDFKCQDILASNSKTNYDILLFTLTLHHFKNDEIKSLLKKLIPFTSIGIIINDLHRHKVAYTLFLAICFIFRLNSLSKDDGLISILRGFKKQELKTFTRKIKGNHSIKWKWAFRYQWIISKT